MRVQAESLVWKRRFENSATSKLNYNALKKMHFEVKIYNIPTKKDCQNRIFTRKNRFLIIIIIIFF